MISMMSIWNRLSLPSYVFFGLRAKGFLKQAQVLSSCCLVGPAIRPSARRSFCNLAVTMKPLVEIMLAPFGYFSPLSPVVLFGDIAVRPLFE